MGWWMIPTVITIPLLVMFILLITREAAADYVGLAGPFLLVISIVISLITWLVYFIIF